jgi:uncharacterized cupredoxin-like copper-binding protein
MPRASFLCHALLFGALLALVAGCGDDAPRRLDRPVLRVRLDEYKITPQNVSVPAGRLQIIARNDGRLTHNLRIELPPKDPDEQTRQLGGTPTAHPGQTVRATVTLRPGKYRITCTIANHDDLGMYGTLIVR